MVEKISCDELRQKNTKEIQRIINDQKKAKMDVFAEEMGTKNPSNPSESIGTIKRNIARCKTVINERMRQNN